VVILVVTLSILCPFTLSFAGLARHTFADPGGASSASRSFRGRNCRDRSNGTFRDTSPFAKRRGATVLAVAIVG
jgi:hypothetical protein